MKHRLRWQEARNILLDIQLVIPMTELTSTLLLENSSCFPEVTLPFPEIETLDSLADKISLMRLARSLKIPTPESWIVDNPLDSSINFEKINYPVVLKAPKSPSFLK